MLPVFSSSPLPAPGSWSGRTSRHSRAGGGPSIAARMLSSPSPPRRRGSRCRRGRRYPGIWIPAFAGMTAVLSPSHTHTCAFRLRRGPGRDGQAVPLAQTGVRASPRECCRARHPRADGGPGSCAVWCCAAVGSPPRRRGSRVLRGLVLRGSWVTPAQAGVQERQGVDKLQPPRHPRAGGGPGSCAVWCCAAVGSPPRRRGSRRHRGRRYPGIWIPAFAGMTAVLSPSLAHTCASRLRPARGCHPMA
jgi:hypothetical protein